MIETIASATSNDDGYYSVSTEFEEVGSFQGYYLQAVNNSLQNTLSSDFIDKSAGSSSDVLIDAKVYVNLPIVFHIKNNSPFNSNDSFDKILFHPEGYTQDVYDTILDGSNNANLQGMNVDLTITVNQLDNYNDFNQTYYHLKYLFTKNGIPYEKYDTVRASCPDTSQIEVYY
ncbi:hypothetical protein BH11BAC1_BH11BAC1_28910 [soil metagenome]